MESVLRRKQIIKHHCVDIEYDKYKEDKKKKSNGQLIRSDVIVHQRKSANRNNLIVIEAKKKYPSKHDRAKVTDLSYCYKVFRQ